MTERQARPEDQFAIVDEATTPGELRELAEGLGSNALSRRELNAFLCPYPIHSKLIPQGNREPLTWCVQRGWLEPLGDCPEAAHRRLERADIIADIAATSTTDLERAERLLLLCSSDPARATPVVRRLRPGECDAVLAQLALSSFPVVPDALHPLLLFALNISGPHAVVMQSAVAAVLGRFAECDFDPEDTALVADVLMQLTEHAYPEPLRRAAARVLASLPDEAYQCVPGICGHLLRLAAKPTADTVRDVAERWMADRLVHNTHKRKGKIQ